MLTLLKARYEETIFFTLLFCSCTPMKHNDAQGSFGYDLAFLSARDSVIVLAGGDSRVIVSPR